MAGALFAATRRRLPLNRRANFVLVALAAILPILVAMLAHPAFYNGLRHFVFVVPPFAAIGGLAGAWLFERAHAFGKAATAALAAIFVGSLALPVSDMVRLHPYQYTAFNWASAGRTDGARQLHAGLLGACIQTGGHSAACQTR